MSRSLSGARGGVDAKPCEPAHAGPAHVLSAGLNPCRRAGLDVTLIAGERSARPDTQPGKMLELCRKVRNPVDVQRKCVPIDGEVLAFDEAEPPKVFKHRDKIRARRVDRRTARRDDR